jgi:hypothetical protein
VKVKQQAPKTTITIANNLQKLNESGDLPFTCIINGNIPKACSCENGKREIKSMNVNLSN